MLSIFHTAVPDLNQETGETLYEVESPDEAAFVVAAKEVGFDFYKRTQTSIVLREHDPESSTTIVREYTLLHLLKFSSARKRMSVIVMNEENKILLLSKGAGSAIDRLSDNGRAFDQETKEHINKYAEAGLRTLAIAYRELKEEEFNDWDPCPLPSASKKKGLCDKGRLFYAPMSGHGDLLY